MYLGVRLVTPGVASAGLSCTDKEAAGFRSKENLISMPSCPRGLSLCVTVPAVLSLCVLLCWCAHCSVTAHAPVSLCMLCYCACWFATARAAASLPVDGVQVQRGALCGGCGRSPGVRGGRGGRERREPLQSARGRAAAPLAPGKGAQYSSVSCRSTVVYGEAERGGERRGPLQSAHGRAAAALAPGKGAQSCRSTVL